MKIGKSGLDLIKKFEGCELKAYLDIAGIPTIGYGHTETVSLSDVKAGKTITQEEAEALLRSDLESREAALTKAINIEVNQNEFDALLSFVYNLGIQNFCRSTLRKYLNLGLKNEASKQFLQWNKARVNGELKVVYGLTRRREAEKTLFLTPVE